MPQTNPHHLLRCKARSLRSTTILQVIDLISLKPFDMEAITNSVHKTKRVIIVEECMKTGGIGASLSATINESCFDHLDHQVRRRSCPGASAGAGMSGGGPSAFFGAATCLAFASG